MTSPSHIAILTKEEAQHRVAVLEDALQDLLATARDSSWAHITSASEDDPCRCKGCSVRKAKMVLDWQG